MMGSEGALLARRQALIRSKRERRRQAFLDKFERTPQKARRWFRMEDIEPDEIARTELVKRWRSSIWHGDLMVGEKSQVLCLAAHHLMEENGGNRLPSSCARGEQFYQAAGELWMSAPRWLRWFEQVEIAPPVWLASLQAKREAALLVDPPESDPGVKTQKDLPDSAVDWLPAEEPVASQPKRRQLYLLLLKGFPDRRVPKNMTAPAIRNKIAKHLRHEGINPVDDRIDTTIKRLLKRR
jgi:hypothetical protein